MRNRAAAGGRVSRSAVYLGLLGSTARVRVAPLPSAVGVAGFVVEQGDPVGGAGAERGGGQDRRGRADHLTSTTNLVPRTPSIEVGVRTRIASRLDLAMLPETTPTEPRLTLVTNDPVWRDRS